MKTLTLLALANVVTLLWDVAQTAAKVVAVVLVGALAARALGLL